MVRYKNRYFVAELEVINRPSHAPLSVNKNALQSSILKKIHQIHGDFGLASVLNGFRVKYCNPYTKILLIRTRHGPHKFVGTVLPLIKSVGDVNIQFHILHVGGTMMKCFKFVRNYQLSRLEKYWNQMKTDSDRQQLKEAIMKITLSV